jgi:hypothetical protein
MRSRSRYYLLAFLPVCVLTLPFLIGWAMKEIRLGNIASESQRLLDAALAETTAQDPNWTFDKLQASLPDVPDGENLFLQMNRVKVFLGAGFQRRPSGNGHLFENAYDLAVNQLWDDDEISELRLHQKTYAPAVLEALKLEHFPKSRIWHQPTENPLLMPLSHPQHIREVIALMQLQVYLHAIDRQPNEAMPLLRGMLRTADSLSDDFFLISHLVRNAGRSLFVGALQKLLALGEPGTELATLLEPLRQATATNRLIMGIRGERASSNLQFEFIGKSTDSMTSATRDLMYGLSGVEKDKEPLTSEEYRAYFKGDQAANLRAFLELIVSFDKPLHEQRQIADQIARKYRNRETPLTNALLPAIVKVFAAEQRCTAQLDCARVGIACELFRLKHQRWPETLQEIPKEWLPEIPLDPYNGKPLGYRKLAHSIRIYCIGEDGLDDEMRPEENEGTARTSRMYRFELWNPENRRLPPPPPPPEELHEPRELPD